MFLILSQRSPKTVGKKMAEPMVRKVSLSQTQEIVVRNKKTKRQTEKR